MNGLEEVINHISQTVKFDSTQTEPLDGMPFGKGAADCLEYFLNLAQSFGFETKNYDNYAGEVIFGGSDDNTAFNEQARQGKGAFSTGSLHRVNDPRKAELNAVLRSSEESEFAILAHLDVVPAGRGWHHDPFGGEIDYANSRIWGRGTMDDKGPAVIILHCLKQLKDEGIVPKRKIKLIVGCNEESGWECIKYYKAHAVMPEEGFSPDADFPVIYAEKGILQLELRFPAKGVKYISGGERANMVCDYCETYANGAPLQKGLTLENGKVISRGKSAHASTPHMGENAIRPILSYLGHDEAVSLLFDNGFGLENLNDVTGALTFSPDVIRCDENYIYVTCDIRFPATYKKDDVLGAIEAKNIPYEILSYQAPLFNDADCNLIKTLSDTYNEVTGKHMKPVAIGGGTYARALKCGCAFGPEEEGEESTVHKPDEYITFEKIEKCMQIYKLAITRLTCK